MSTLYKYKKQIRQTLVPDLPLRDIKGICSGLFTNIQVTKKSLLQCIHYNYDDIKLSKNIFTALWLICAYKWHTHKGQSCCITKKQGQIIQTHNLCSCTNMWTLTYKTWKWKGPAWSGEYASRVHNNHTRKKINMLLLLEKQWDLLRVLTYFWIRMTLSTSVWFKKKEVCV